MTKRQRIEYKAANQERKARILHLARVSAKGIKHYWAQMHVGQSPRKAYR